MNASSMYEYLTVSLVGTRMSEYGLSLVDAVVVDVAGVGEASDGGEGVSHPLAEDLLAIGVEVAADGPDEREQKPSLEEVSQTCGHVRGSESSTGNELKRLMEKSIHAMPQDIASP
eukprot:746392-Hanusia_phi.AAC.5